MRVLAGVRNPQARPPVLGRRWYSQGSHNTAVGGTSGSTDAGIRFYAARSRKADESVACYAIASQLYHFSLLHGHVHGNIAEDHARKAATFCAGRLAGLTAHAFMEQVQRKALQDCTDAEGLKLQESEAAAAAWGHALVSAFAHCDRLAAGEALAARCSGIHVVVARSGIYIASLGTCRAAVGIESGDRTVSCHASSQPHTILNSVEAKRMANTSDKERMAAAPLATPTRFLCAELDKRQQSGFLAFPDVVRHLHAKQRQYIVLGSPGLWGDDVHDTVQAAADAYTQGRSPADELIARSEGNLKTASTVTTLGRSTVGWSLVGSGLARALADDLDAKMDLLAENMTYALNQTVELQEYLDVVVSLTSSGLNLAATPSAALTDVSFLQQLDDRPFSQLPGLMTASLDKVLEALIEKAVDLLDGLFDVLRPVLEQVGRWILQFGDKIQAIVDAVSGTVDQVQKLLDQLMSQASAGGIGEDRMIHDTYTLFDPENEGYITAEGLQQVADLYALTVLAGNKSLELVEKYDQHGDGKLDLDEFTLMVQDDSVPNLMSAVLRTYAQKLAEVAGNVGSARMRDEVATTVVRYFGLVCAKNMTKVTWVSNRLTNGSLPLEFTADILAQLCLSADDPNKLTTADVGDIVITKMMELNSTATLAAFDLVSDPTFWVTEGLPANDQPRCVEMLTSWVMNATGSTGAFLDDQARVPHGLSEEALAAMPTMARRLASERMLKFRKQQQQKRLERRQELLSNAASRTVVQRLLGGTLASEGNDPAAINEALNSGVPARPETLEFAQFLSQNASHFAAQFQKQCMEYTSQSSSPMDSVSTVVQGMTKKFNGFLAMMEKYATPQGLEALEAKVKDFAEHAADDARLVIEEKLGKFLNKTAPAIVDSLEGAIHSAGNALSHTLGQTIGEPFAAAVGKPLGMVIGQVANNTAMGTVVGEKLGEVLTEEIVNVTERVLGDKIGDVLETVIDGALEHVAGELNGQNGSASELETHALLPPAENLRSALGRDMLSSEVSLRARQVPQEITGAWASLAGMLSSFTKLLPASTGILKYVRLEVSKLTHQLENVFIPLRTRGPEVFNAVAWYWCFLWCTYYVLMLCLLTGILFYAFWASGFCGGPGHLCLWSAIIAMQIIVLLLFVVSLLLCILAGVKVFITSGCAKVYILSDKLVCGESLTTIRSWLDSFYVADALLSLEEVCEREILLTCAVIAEQLQVSMLLTTIFSFLAVVLSMQITVDTAVLHERARWLRVLARMQKEDKGK